MYVLRQDNWWIASWEGDPPRTLRIESAKAYKTLHGARVAKGYFEKRYSHIRKMDLSIEPLKLLNNGGNYATTMRLLYQYIEDGFSDLMDRHGYVSREHMLEYIDTQSAKQFSFNVMIDVLKQFTMDEEEAAE